MLQEVLKHVPVVGQAIGFTRTAMKVYNSTSPIEAVKNATVSIIDDCSPPVIKYPVKCAVLAAQISLVVSSGGTSLTAAIALACARQIIE